MTIDLVFIVQLVLVGLLVAGLKGLFSIDRHLAELNGSVREVKGWQVSHEKLDNVRGEQVSKELKALWERVNSSHP